MAHLSPGLTDAVTARWSFSDRGLSCKVRPTYVGRRVYQTADGPVAVLRREGQVNAPGHLETMKRIVGTRRHPSRDGKRVFLSAAAAPGTPAPWDPSVELWPHKDFFAGSVGDSIELVDVPGLGRVPELEATVCDADTLRDVRDGAVEVSYGYVSWFVPAAEVPVGGDIVDVGKWKNPATGAIEDFDVEGLVDPTDPRIPEDMRPFIGGNHLAFALGTNGTRGRGGPEIRLLLDSVGDDLALPACRLFTLQRVGDATEVVAAVLASGTDDGPACALWTTTEPKAAAYASLGEFRSMHVADGLELALAVMGRGPQQEMQITPAEAGEDKDMADPTPPPGGDKPAPDAGDPAAMLVAKTKAYDELMTKYNTLLEEFNKLKASMQQTEDAKTAAVAAADSLRIELAPFKAQALKHRRDEVKVLLGVADEAEPSELATSIDKADETTLPGIAVRAHFEAHPEARAVIDDYDAKIKDAAWCRGMLDSLRAQPRQAKLRAVGSQSDAFERSFKKTDKPTDGDKTMQARLDALQNGGA